MTYTGHELGLRAAVDEAIEKGELQQVLELLKPVLLQPEEHSAAIVVDGWLKAVWATLLLGNLDQARTLLLENGQRVASLSSRHWELGRALVAAQAQRDPSVLRRAAERFSQGFRAFADSGYPELFERLEVSLLAPGAAPPEPYDYRVTSYVLWQGGLDDLVGSRYREALGKLLLSIERYRFAGLIGDTLWSWYDTIVTYLFLDEVGSAQELYNRELSLAVSVSSRFLAMTDRMMSSYNTRKVDGISVASTLLSHEWPGYASSQYPVLFAHFETKITGEATAWRNYARPPFLVWATGIELLNMGFLSEAVSAFEEANRAYEEAGLSEPAAGLGLLTALARACQGNFSEARRQLAATVPRLQDLGEETLLAGRELLKLLEGTGDTEAVLADRLKTIAWPTTLDIPALARRLKTSIATLAIGHSLAVRPGQAQIRRELTIERQGASYSFYLYEQGAVIQRKAIRIRVDQSELQSALRALALLTCQTEAIRRGLQIQLPSEAILSPAVHLSQELRRLGALLSRLLLPQAIRNQLRSLEQPTSVLLNLGDDLLQHPWEILHDGNSHLCLQHNLARSVHSDQVLPQSVRRRSREKIRFLVVGDPREEDPQLSLPSSRSEAVVIATQLRAMGNVEVTLLVGAEATSTRVLEELSSGYDVFHFSGHVFYGEEGAPEGPSLVLANREVPASTLKGFIDEDPPLLAFMNACESGREIPWLLGPADESNRAFGLASTFLGAGCYYIGAMWPVFDEPASDFALAFYSSILIDREPLGVAIRIARQRVYDVHAESDLSWSSYTLYGDPAVRLFEKRTGPAEI